MIHPVILCGGSGTRLWPTPRRAYPKQFAPLIGRREPLPDDPSPFSAPDFAAPLVMTGDEFRFLAERTGRGDRPFRCPRRGRAGGARHRAAILAAALMLVEDVRTPDAGGASDHSSPIRAAFSPPSRRGAWPADGALVTFGVVPARPETGYGYLELEGPPGRGAGAAGELPREARRARRPTMIAAGHISGTGLFLCGPSARCSPRSRPMRPTWWARSAPRSTRARGPGLLPSRAEASRAVRAISVDYAIMEPAGGGEEGGRRCRSTAAGPTSGPGTRSGSRRDRDADGRRRDGAVTAVDAEDSSCAPRKSGCIWSGLVSRGRGGRDAGCRSGRRQGARAGGKDGGRDAAPPRWRRPRTIRASTGPGDGTRRSASAPGSR